MVKILLVLALISAASAESTYRHLWQQNAAKQDQSKFTRNGGRIVGGEPTHISEVPHQAAMHFRENFRCGGSILNTNTILSAAHCTFALDHNDFQFRVGTTLRTQTDLIPVSQVIEHEEYDDFTLDHDIVIMKLLFHVVEGPYIRRATLPLPSHYTAAGYEAVVSGWGDLAWGNRDPPEHLQSVRVTVMTNDACQILYPEYPIHEFHICAGDYGRDACQGDSGGPLTENHGMPSAIVIGVVNWGYYCAFEWPTVYSRVSYYIPWILPLL